MTMQRLCVFVAAGLLAGPALARTTNGPLNLQVPPDGVPVTAASATTRPVAAPGRYYGDTTGHTSGGGQVATAPASSGTTATPAHSAPGVYYGDTSGRIYSTAATTPRPACDDSTYNQTQMHGSVGMGVAGGSRWNGNWGGATVNFSKAFGSCEHPTGGISISISGANGSFHGR